MVVILFLLNVPKLLLQGFVVNQNGTEKVVCLKSMLTKPFEIAGLTVLLFESLLAAKIYLYLRFNILYI